MMIKELSSSYYHQQLKKRKIDFDDHETVLSDHDIRWKEHHCEQRDLADTASPDDVQNLIPFTLRNCKNQHSQCQSVPSNLNDVPAKFHDLSITDQNIQSPIKSRRPKSKNLFGPTSSCHKRNSDDHKIPSRQTGYARATLAKQVLQALLPHHLYVNSLHQKILSNKQSCLIPYFDNFPDELFLLLFEYFKDQEIPHLQLLNKQFQRLVQLHASQSSNIRMSSSKLSVKRIQRLALPAERHDIWTSPIAPPQYLPQSLLHGRCGALLHFIKGEQEEQLQGQDLQVCQNCGVHFICNNSQCTPSSSNDQTKFQNALPNTYSIFRSKNRSLNSQKAELTLTGTRWGHKEQMEIQSSGMLKCNNDSGRLVMCGGYGMFELWDHNVTMRCNEIWELGLQSRIWRLHGGMLEQEVGEDTELRFEDRDAFAFVLSNTSQSDDSQRGSNSDSSGDSRPNSFGHGIGCVLRLVVFGQANRKNTCHHVFDRIGFLDLGTLTNANNAPGPPALPQLNHEALPLHQVVDERIIEGVDNQNQLLNYRHPLNVPRYLFPFNSTLDFRSPTWRYVNPILNKKNIPEKRESFASCLLRPPTLQTNGLLVLFGGYGTSLKCLDDLYVLDIPKEMARRYLPVSTEEIPKPKWSFIHSTSKLDSQGPCGRFGHSLTCMGSRAFLFGGKAELTGDRPDKNKNLVKPSSVLLSDLWTLTFHAEDEKNKSTFKWFWKRMECTGLGPTPRTGHRGISVGKHFIIFGGFSGNRYMNDFNVLNTATFMWTKLNLSSSLRMSKRKASIRQSSLLESQRGCSNPCKIFVTSRRNTRSITRRQRVLDERDQQLNDDSSDSFPIIRQRRSLNRKKIRLTEDMIIDGDVSEDYNHIKNLERSRAVTMTNCNSDKMISKFDYKTIVPKSLFSMFSDKQKYRPLYLSQNLDKVCPNCKGILTEAPNVPTQSWKSLSQWISPRMEPSIVFDGNRSLIVFGGSNRFRWDCKQLRFNDFSNDLFRIELGLE